MTVIEAAMIPECRIIREGHFAERIVFVDGLWGCGKTMLSPIFAAMERVELLSYSYEIEYICSLYYLGRIAEDAAVAMVRLLTDNKLYNLMMARDVNFRWGDLSSAFRDAKPLRYFLRMFQRGDEHIPDKIRQKKPILHLTTHHMLGFSAPIYSALGSRAVFIEVVRHPLYMIKQQALNMDKLLCSPRDFTIYFDHQNQQLPYYVRGWEREFLSGNSLDKAIHYVDQMTRLTDAQRKKLKEELGAQILTIPFEAFVVNPWPYIQQIEQVVGTASTRTTRRMMKKQRVPRAMYSDGIGLKIYKRCGWEPPQSKSNLDELSSRRDYAVANASKEAVALLDRLSADYEKNHL